MDAAISYCKTRTYREFLSLSLIQRHSHVDIHRFGLSFIGLPFTESKLIGYAYAFEQFTKVRDQVDPIVMAKTELQDVLGKDSEI